MAVDRPHRMSIKQLATRDRYAHLDDRDRGPDRGIDRFERADRRRHRLRQRVQPQRDLADRAQRALAADVQAREVVTGAALARAGAGADQSPVRRRDRQPEHVLLHRAVAHRIRAAGPRGRHAADRCIRAGVDREEQSLVPDLRIELVARDAGLHGHRQVLGVDAEDALHPRQVQAHAALHRQQVAFERGSGAVGDHRHAMRVGQGQHRGDLVVAFGEDDRLRRRHVEGRFVATMLLAQGHRSAAAVAEARLQRLQHRRRHRARGVDRLVRRAGVCLAVTEFSRRVHRGLLVPPFPDRQHRSAGGSSLVDAMDSRKTRRCIHLHRPACAATRTVTA